MKICPFISWITCMNPNSRHTHKHSIYIQHAHPNLIEGLSWQRQQEGANNGTQSIDHWQTTVKMAKAKDWKMFNIPWCSLRLIKTRQLWIQVIKRADWIRNLMFWTRIEFLKEYTTLFYMTHFSTLYQAIQKLAKTFLLGELIIVGV